MGLTSSSTGAKVLEADVFEKAIGCDFTIGLAGNPNVGKSTVFNALTGMHQHTGNWPGKTVSNAVGKCRYKDKDLLFVDIPGTYSLMSNSEEEEIARNYICFGQADVTVVVVDATALERNLNLVFQTFEITNNVIVCVNLLDEAKKKGIKINLELLSEYLGVPVVGVTARRPKTLNSLLSAIYSVCTNKMKVSPKCVKYNEHIEEAIEKITEKLKQTNIKNTYLYRWIALKLIDGDEKILKSLKNYLDIDLLADKNISLLVEKAKVKLMTNNITKNNFRDRVVEEILQNDEEICEDVLEYEVRDYNDRDRKVDKILTSKTFGIPLMILFLGVIFWLTITGANYPSEMLSVFFGYVGDKLYALFDYLHAPVFLKGVLIDGMYNTLSWVISVMLPPMAIFFPLFTILEDLGYLPRIAFNLDHYFKKACASGKQALTMCMGFGCNAAGVIGCRIINSTRERLIAILTNAFVPCNGRFPFLIAVASIFIGGVGFSFGNSILSTLAVLLVIILGIILTLFISKFLSKTVLKGMPSTLTLELPPYRKPQIGRILVRSIFDRTLYVLGRAMVFAAPAGIVIWLMANIGIGNASILTHIATFLNPFAQLMGLDGYILTAFILGLPANEIVLPIILMCYLGKGTMVDIENTMEIGKVLIANGWTILTAVNVMIFTLLHFPCATTLMTIKSETKSFKWTALAFILPTVCGIALCMFTNLIYHIII
ncbi:ferrous iron transport protein B [Anaerofustis stercorihominis]|uniref:ferrous iron transport protein B n=1 Tax=Anaerofustis stercorihominis TaxID=214853 RepID=UPI00214CC825|nr:ferrous iron transport protein B [Anaerofustis stercorihominis]MCR2032716.1 ferrous iron transport protein B [Anaerofustis stercorihominis]